VSEQPLAAELAALAAYERDRIATGRTCEVHRAAMPCEFCARYLPVVFASGRLAFFDLGPLTAVVRAEEESNG
jgi:hypothetical protein